MTWPDLRLNRIVTLEAGELVRSLLWGSRREMKVVWTMMVSQQTGKSDRFET